MAGNLEQLKIRKMQKEDLPQAVAVIGKAFATQPNTVAMNPGKPVSPKALEVTFTARFKYLPGQIFVAELDGKIAGVIRMVEWPNCQATPLQNLKMMPAMLGAIGGFHPLMRGMKLLGAWKKHDPKKPHWHIDPLVVTPELQGRGIGSQIMKFYCNIIDEKGIEAYHETDRPENVPFYGKFGFTVIGEEIINGAKNWYLLRPAKPVR